MIPILNDILWIDNLDDFVEKCIMVETSMASFMGNPVCTCNDRTRDEGVRRYRSTALHLCSQRFNANEYIDETFPEACFRHYDWKSTVAQKMLDYYGVLQIKQDASDDDIKKVGSNCSIFRNTYALY